MHILIFLPQFLIKAPRYIFLYLVVCLLMLSIHAQAAEVSAEIININPTQKVFFVDVGKDVFSLGDIVIVNNIAEPVYLEVIETSAGISQLAFSSNAAFRSLTDSLENVSIGMSVTRVYVNPSTHNKGIDQLTITEQGLIPQLQQMPSTVAVTVPTIAMQPVDKTDITKESIESLGIKMDKMAENNARLVNALAQCQAGQADVQKINTTNALLKKQVDESTVKFEVLIAERDKYKKMADERNTKILELKERLNHLNSTIQEQLK